MIFCSLCILPFCFIFHLAQNLVREKRSSNHNTRYEAWLFRDGIHKYSKIYQNFRVVNVKKFYIDLASFGLDISSPLWEWLDKVKVWAGTAAMLSVCRGPGSSLFASSPPVDCFHVHGPEWLATMFTVPKAWRRKEKGKGWLALPFQGTMWKHRT